MYGKLSVTRRMGERGPMKTEKPTLKNYMLLANAGIIAGGTPCSSTP